MTSTSDDYLAQPGDSTPRPDPTRLTTQLVDRALAAKMEVVDTRFNSMDQANKLLAIDVAKLETLSKERLDLLRIAIDRNLAAQREYIISYINRIADVSSEKFDGIKTQFVERDTRTEQTDKERRTSLDAALAAAKEAVAEQQKANALAIGKSEDGTKERLDALNLLMTTNIKSLEDKISDLKSRLDSGEGGHKAVAETKIERRLDNNLVIAAIGLIVIIAVAVIGFSTGTR